ncbi:MAG: 1-deoxy-D-xylulose-5-phosphate reductoisomerase, partial [Chthoniobacterales bacterium]|nr:1-deoxy-D-xylulose-5-phosphate reductoisomerase [Chthoniobacterales bacterium]
MNRKRVVVLGATGSIGDSALKVARDIPDRMEIIGLAAYSSAAKLAEQANELRPEAVCIVDESKIGALRAALNYSPRIFAGKVGLCEIATLGNSDMVLIAVVGTGGLRPALAAVEAGKDLAVASKEILVMAGDIVMKAAAAKHVRVLPVDSEHNAIFQCLAGRVVAGGDDPGGKDHSGRAIAGVTDPGYIDVRRLILTASGGPFRETPVTEFASITPEQALRHPTWNMGPKITIDSATLFNKGLEMI